MRLRLLHHDSNFSKRELETVGFAFGIVFCLLMQDGFSSDGQKYNFLRELTSAVLKSDERVNMTQNKQILIGKLKYTGTAFPFSLPGVQVGIFSKTSIIASLTFSEK